jgi:ATP-utilising chromatin assembly and remodelling N-terminal
MDFWEALRSEVSLYPSTKTHMQRRAARGVDQAFPEALKEPVLRKIQFSTVSRLDHLVEDVYEVPKPVTSSF